MTLFPSLRSPEPPSGIDLRRCDVAEMLADVRGARLIVADPPWAYSEGAAGKGKAQPELNGIYDVIGDAQIVAHLDIAGRERQWIGKHVDRPFARHPISYHGETVNDAA